MEILPYMIGLILSCAVVGFLAYKHKQSKVEEKSKEEREEDLVRTLIERSNTGDLSEIRSQRLEWESMVEDKLLQLDPSASSILDMYRQLIRREERKKIHDDLIRLRINSNTSLSADAILIEVGQWVIDETSNRAKTA